MDAWIKRSRLVYPSGIIAGVDSTHLAFTPQNNSVVTAVAAGSGGSMINILTGQSGTIAGAPTSTITEIGPVVNYDNTALSNSWTTLAPSFLNNFVCAAIITPTASAGDQFIVGYNLSTPTGLELRSLVPDLLKSGSGGTSPSGLTALTAGVPYFVAASFALNQQNWITVNLRSGQIQTAQTATALGVFSSLSATVMVGGTGVANEGADSAIAAACFIGNQFLSLPQLIAWGMDPWSFWYPQPEENWVGVFAAAVEAPRSFAPRSFPPQWSPLALLRQNLAVDVPPATTADTPTYSVPLAHETQWNVDVSLVQGGALDASLASETNTFFARRTWPLVWQPSRALWQITAQDFSSLGVETNVHFIPRAWPLQWNLQRSLMRITAQDFSSTPPIITLLLRPLMGTGL